MAGTLYLGNQKVTPVIVQGGGEQTVMPLFDVVDGELAWKSVITADGLKKITKTPFYELSDRSIFRGRSEIEEIYFPDAELIGEDCRYFLSGCSNLSVVSFPNVTEIKSSGLFLGCSGCSSLTTFDFSSLEKINSLGLCRCFLNCSITECRFAKVDYLGSYALSECFMFNTTLQNIYFNSLKSTSFETTDVFEDMLYSVTGCTVHFPSNLQSVIGGWSDVVGGFGGTNTTVLFDLPTTE